jgi:hypothetical protein
VFPVDEIINKNMCQQARYNYFCKNDMYYLLGQYAFGAKPKHPFIQLLIDTIHSNIDEIIQQYSMSTNKEIYVYSTTGPDYVSKVFLNYSEKDRIKVLHNNSRQYFGNYAQHKYFGTWK